MKHRFILLTLVIVNLLCGCAFNRPNYTRTTYSTNGIMTVEKLSVPTYAIWPATTELGKQRVSIGKTISVGTSGLSEDGGSTNIAEAFKALADLVRAVKTP